VAFWAEQATNNARLENAATKMHTAGMEIAGKVMESQRFNDAFSSDTLLHKRIKEG